MVVMTLPAEISSLTQCLKLVVECARAEGFAPQRVTEIELAVEEAMANICLYAYPESRGEVEVRCGLDEAKHFYIELVDMGIPFDILAMSLPDLTVEPAQRPIGGLGILLILAFMDYVTYHREGAHNVLRLTARRPQLG
ncbi:MAG: ATP-binding protein [Candidatus Tectomicrobia bacterium]|uniref:ATP-binding protein n=1 Tax=Tectimicrobiota bacterium TaxID=2528274 RepID=A0A938B4X7_UNCTE|nr:ATP-binding protein [Candidatus Tectomicrobia bacterium]